MNDLTFYQCLVRCFNQQKYCKMCPLYAQGHRQNGNCMLILMDEISNRKSKAFREEEEADSDAVHL